MSGPRAFRRAAGRAVAFGLAVTAIALPAAPAAATSLWKGDAGSLYSDFRAQRVGDLVTILVADTTSANMRESSVDSRSTTIDLASGSGLLFFLPPAGWTSGLERDESRTAARSSGLRARITVPVVEVLTNGLLRVEGTRNVVVNRTPYRLTVGGVIRRVDLSADNVVASDRVADAVIIFDGQEPQGRAAAARGQERPPSFGQILVNGFAALLRMLFFWAY